MTAAEKPPLVIEWGKAVILLAVVVSATVLAVIGVVSGDAAIGVLLIILGYVAGNGRVAARQHLPSPLIGVQPEPDDGRRSQPPIDPTVSRP